MFIERVHLLRSTSVEMITNYLVSIRYVGFREIADRSSEVEDSRRRISFSFSSSSRSSSKEIARLISVCPRARDFHASSLMT